MASYVLAARDVIRHERVGETARYYIEWAEEVDNVVVGKLFEAPGGKCGAEEVQFEFKDCKSYGIFWKFRDLCLWIRTLSYMVGCDADDPSTFDETTPFYEIFEGGPEAIFGSDVCAKLAADFALWEAHNNEMCGGVEVGYKWIREAFEYAKKGGVVSLCAYPKRMSKDIA